MKSFIDMFIWMTTKREKVFNIRYASIRNLDVSNGEGIGIALFVQGCHFKCKNCFNPETWDFNGGKEWTPEVEDKFIELASRPYIKRISLLGGECLADENLDGVLSLVNKMRLLMPEKTIWLYTGYELTVNPYTYDKQAFICHPKKDDAVGLINDYIRSEIIKQCNVVVDGRYIDSERDITLKWKGSKSQRVINIEETLKQNKIILYCD